MARETKSISVTPNNEQSTIELFQLFGWELVSSQEIFNRDTHKETRDDGVYNVTTTTNYVKLVFSRETTMLNYTKIVALEKEYQSVTDSLKHEKLWKIGAIISIFVGSACVAEGPILQKILFGLVLAGGIVLSILFIKKKFEAIRETKTKRNAILQKVRNLWKRQ